MLSYDLSARHARKCSSTKKNYIDQLKTFTADDVPVHSIIKNVFINNPNTFLLKCSILEYI